MPLFISTNVFLKEVYEFLGNGGYNVKKLLILGASGLVGKAVVEECRENYDVYGTYFSSPINLPEDKQFHLDLSEQRIIEILQEVQPDIIISSLSGDFDEQLNFHKTLANEMKNNSSDLYFISTTNVFDGDLSKHHCETDEPISKSEYGQYKINCEKMLTQMLGERCTIIRIPGMWGKDSPRFNELKVSIRANEPIKPYSNLQCSFMLDVQLARQLHYIFDNGLNGIFHLGSTNRILEMDFFTQLIGHFTTTQVNIEPNAYEDAKKLYYFGLISKRDDIPQQLLMTNEQIILNLHT